MKNIILINSSTRPSQVLVDLFHNLDRDKFSLFIFSTNNSFLRQFQHKAKDNKLIFLGPKIKSTGKKLMFLLLFPFIFLQHFLNVFAYKERYNVDILICVEPREKIIFTIIAKYLKMKIVWIEKPIVKNLDNHKKLLYILRSLANKNKVKIVSFLESDRNKLIKYGFQGDNIVNISLGIKKDFSKHQDSIFSGIANSVSAKNYHNRFSVGVFLDDKKKNDLDIVFNAIKICMDRFYNIRLVVIGDEKIRKTAMWLAKEAGIGELSCFIGNTNDLGKVQQSIDVFLALDIYLKLVDLFRVLSAMMLKIPIISMKDGVMSELLIDQKTGVLINRNSSEELAEIIVRLQKDELYRNAISENAYKYVIDNFSLKKQVLKFEKILSEL